MREEVGGVNYDAEARLQFGAPEQRAALGLAKNPSPRAELLLRFKSNRDDNARRTMIPATAIWRSWKKPKKKRGWSRTGCVNSWRKATRFGTRKSGRARGGMARHGGAVARAGKQGRGVCEGIRTRRRAAGRRTRRILRQHGNRRFAESAQVARQSVAGRAGHCRVALATGRLVAR